VDILEALPHSLFIDHSDTIRKHVFSANLIVNNEWRILRFLEQRGIVPEERAANFDPSHSEVTVEGLDYMYEKYFYIFDHNDTQFNSNCNFNSRLLRLLQKDYYLVKNWIAQKGITSPDTIFIEISLGLVEEIRKYGTFQHKHLTYALQQCELEICDILLQEIKNGFDELKEICPFPYKSLRWLWQKGLVSKDWLEDKIEYDRNRKHILEWIML
jgi:hypothetical protein